MTTSLRTNAVVVTRVHCTHWKSLSLDKTILMSTYNMHFQIIKKKMLKYPLIFVLVSFRNNVPETQKRVRMSFGKGAVSFRVIDV